MRLYFVFEEFPSTEVIFQNGKRRRKKGKTGQSNPREEVTTMLDLMYLTIMKLTAVMAMMMFLMRTEIMKEAMMFATTPMMLASLVMVTMVMVTTVMALLTILVAMTAMMLVTHLTVVILLVKEERKGKHYSNLREEVTTIVDFMYLTIMKLTAVMAMAMFLVGTEKK